MTENLTDGMVRRLPPKAHGAKERPPYAIQSVDNALRLAAILQAEGSVTVSDAAQRLGVAASTAHRLLGMLVYRDFATHDGHGAYRRGPILGGLWLPTTAVAMLREVAQPHLEELAQATGETCNIEVRAADHVRFIASAEGTRTVRISSREGMSFPLHRTSGGLVLLAAMSPEQLDALYDPSRFVGRERELPSMPDLRRLLATVRRTVTAVNVERSEAGVAAVGHPVLGADGEVVAAIAISLPVARFETLQVSRLRTALARTAEAIHTDLCLRELA